MNAAREIIKEKSTNETVERAQRNIQKKSSDTDSTFSLVSRSSNPFFLIPFLLWGAIDDDEKDDDRF